MEPGFKYDGALAPDRHAHLYVERQEDQAVWQVLNDRAGIDCCIVSLIGARQTGKTSLLNRLQTRCSEANAGWITIKLDLSRLTEFQGEQWYQQLSVACCERLRKQNIVLSVKDLQDHSVSVFLQPFTARGWAELLLLACQRLEPGQKLLVILDELNSTPLDQWEPFFSNIRAIHQAASSLDDRPEYRTLNFVLAGTFVPTQLIKNVEHSPFNVSTKVYMLPVAAEQLAPLLKLLSQAGKSLESAAEERIYYWTAGLLLHVQRLCVKLMATPEDSVTIPMVDRCAEEIQFDDTYLSHVVKRLGEHEHLARRAAAILERPLKSDRNSDIIATLEIIGVIRHQPAMHHWCITNRLCELTLVNHFSAYFAQGGTEAVSYTHLTLPTICSV